MRKALFFVTEDFGFVSHRIPMAKAVASCGFDVVVVAHENPKKSAAKTIKSLGFKFVPLSIRRGSTRVLGEFKAMVKFWLILRKERPNLLFNVAFKPIIYGSLCARLCKTKNIINLITGTGSLFIDSPCIKSKFICSLVKFCLRIVLGFKNQHLIVQNSDDFKAFGAYTGQIRKIRGSGVDGLSPIPEPMGLKFTATFVGRMIKDKGVLEFIEAAKVLKSKGIRMLLVGSPDPENPSSLSESLLVDLA
ncbi:MAG: hypothetical protein LBI30_04050, partial [Holosporales bacterium]|nr:hypothetical protein [Holosporales bacterium]